MCIKYYIHESIYQISQKCCTQWNKSIKIYEYCYQLASMLIRMPMFVMRQPESKWLPHSFLSILSTKFIAHCSIPSGSRIKKFFFPSLFIPKINQKAKLVQRLTSVRSIGYNKIVYESLFMKLTFIAWSISPMGTNLYSNIH
jgi:hypothetical protein